MPRGQPCSRSITHRHSYKRGKCQEEDTSDRVLSDSILNFGNSLLLGQQLLVSLQGTLKGSSFNCRSNLKQSSTNRGLITPSKPVTQTGLPSPWKSGCTGAPRGEPGPETVSMATKRYFGTTGQMQQFTPAASCSKISSVCPISR